VSRTAFPDLYQLVCEFASSAAISFACEFVAYRVQHCFGHRNSAQPGQLSGERVDLGILDV
jgi:hypothetical protein